MAKKPNNLPPWLMDDDEDDSSSPPPPPKPVQPIQPPVQRASGPAPWLQGLDEQGQEAERSDMLAGQALNRDWLESGAFLAESAETELTYDEWYKRQQESKRERSIEEEIPEFLETDDVESVVGAAPAAAPKGTGVLPDWFLGMEALNPEEEPEWMRTGDQFTAPQDAPPPERDLPAWMQRDTNAFEAPVIPGFSGFSQDEIGASSAPDADDPVQSFFSSLTAGESVMTDDEDELPPEFLASGFADVQPSAAQGRPRAKVEIDPYFQPPPEPSPYSTLSDESASATEAAGYQTIPDAPDDPLRALFGDLMDEPDPAPMSAVTDPSMIPNDVDALIAAGPDASWFDDEPQYAADTDELAAVQERPVDTAILRDLDEFFGDVAATRAEQYDPSVADEIEDPDLNWFLRDDADQVAASLESVEPVAWQESPDAPSDAPDVSQTDSPPNENTLSWLSELNSIVNKATRAPGEVDEFDAFASNELQLDDDSYFKPPAPVIPPPPSFEDYGITPESFGVAADDDVSENTAPERSAIFSRRNPASAPPEREPNATTEFDWAAAEPAPDPEPVATEGINWLNAFDTAAVQAAQAEQAQVPPENLPAAPPVSSGLTGMLNRFGGVSAEPQAEPSLDERSRSMPDLFSSAPAETERGFTALDDDFEAPPILQGMFADAPTFSDPAPAASVDVPDFTLDDFRFDDAPAQPYAPPVQDDVWSASVSQPASSDFDPWQRLSDTPGQSDAWSPSTSGAEAEDDPWSMLSSASAAPAEPEDSANEDPFAALYTPVSSQLPDERFGASAVSDSSEFPNFDFNDVTFSDAPRFDAEQVPTFTATSRTDARDTALPTFDDPTDADEGSDFFSLITRDPEVNVLDEPPVLDDATYEPDWNGEPDAARFTYDKIDVDHFAPNKPDQDDWSAQAAAAEAADDDSLDALFGRVDAQHDSPVVEAAHDEPDDFLASFAASSERKPDDEPTFDSFEPSETTDEPTFGSFDFVTASDSAFENPTFAFDAEPSITPEAEPEFDEANFFASLAVQDPAQPEPTPADLLWDQGQANPTELVVDDDFFDALNMELPAEPTDEPIIEPVSQDEPTFDEFFEEADSFAQPEPEAAAPSAPAFANIDEYLSMLGTGETPEISPRAEALLNQTDVDLDELFSKGLSAERPASGSEGDIAPGIGSEWLSEIQGQVGEVSATAILRQRKDRPEGELPDRLKKLRAREKQVEAKLSTGERAAADRPRRRKRSTSEHAVTPDALEGVLPGAPALAPAPIKPGALTLAQAVALTPDQQAHVDVLRSLIKTGNESALGRSNRLSAIDLTYDTPFLRDLEDNETAIVRQSRTDEAAAAADAAPAPLPARAHVTPPRRYDRLVLAVLIVLAMIAPLFISEFQVAPPIAFAASGAGAAAFDAIDQVASGDYALIAVEYSPASAGELDPITEAVLRHVLLNGGYPVVVSTNPFGGLRAANIVRAIDADAELLASIDRADDALVANLDYTIARYLAGGAIGLRAFAETPPSALNIDIEGANTGLRIGTLDDFAVMVLIADSPDDVRAYAEQVAPLSDAPFTAVVSYAAAPIAEPYTGTAGGFAGLLIGGQDAAAYQAALASIDAVPRGERSAPPQTDSEVLVIPGGAESMTESSNTESMTESTPEAESGGAGLVMTATIIAEQNVNVRSGPGTQFGVVAQVEPGAQVAVIGFNDNSQWVNVRLEDASEGWISAPLIRIDAPTSSEKHIRHARRQDEQPPTRTPRAPATPDANAADIDSDAAPTRTPRATNTRRPATSAGQTATALLSETPDATPTPAPPSATPIVLTVDQTLTADEVRERRWSVFNMGVLASAAVITVGAAVNIIRSLRRRRQND